MGILDEINDNDMVMGIMEYDFKVGDWEDHKKQVNLTIEKIKVKLIESEERLGAKFEEIKFFPHRWMNQPPAVKWRARVVFPGKKMKKSEETDK
jgi:hypothetical protein